MRRGHLGRKKGKEGKANKKEKEIKKQTILMWKIFFKKKNKEKKGNNKT